MKTTDTEKQEAIAKLREWIKPGDRVYTVLRHASTSGMLRAISLLIIHEGRILDVSWLTARACGYSRHEKTGGIVMRGCGMDMGYEVVYTLGRVLNPEGTPERKDGGYSLRHEWL
jgi:hypothetical protein